MSDCILQTGIELYNVQETKPWHGDWLFELPPLTVVSEAAIGHDLFQTMDWNFENPSIQTAVLVWLKAEILL